MKSNRESKSYYVGITLVVLIFFLSQSAVGQFVEFNVYAEDAADPSINGTVTITTDIDWDVVQAGDLHQEYTYIHNKIETIDSGGITLGILDPGLKISVMGNPYVLADFSVSTPGGTTNFTFTSDLLTFGPLMNCTGYAAANVTVSTSGKMLIGNYSQKAFRTFYNGVSDGDGDVFVDLVQTPITGAATVSEDTGGWLSMPGLISSMQSQFKFTLASNASASGNAYYDIEGDLYPEPATIGLFGLGSLALLRRKR